MNPHNLLDEILVMLQSLKDKPELLEKLHQYILYQLYTEEDTAGIATIIPAQYASHCPGSCLTNRNVLARPSRLLRIVPDIT